MRFLLVHNTYQQAGGEDAVVTAERALLMERGHEVNVYRRSNDELRSRAHFAALKTGFETAWSSRSYREISEALRREKPDIAHFHNTFPLISPAAYYACAHAAVPVVQTLHNYRLLCPAATLFRNGSVCESCVGRGIPWPGVVHGCYRDSRVATAAVSAMLAVHHALETWKKKVDVYIALSEFARNKFIQGGLPGERVVVKQNFVHPAPGSKDGEGQYALFVGRLSEEKGLRVLLSAWSKLAATVPLKIAGDGPMLEEVVSEIARRQLQQVDSLGRVPPQEIFERLRGARFLVCPSVWFEGSPMTVLESFACGLPVIASRLVLWRKLSKTAAPDCISIQGMRRTSR